MRPDRFRQRAFLGRDRVARAHEFDVRDADVCNDGRVGRGQFCQHRDLAGMIHADFPNGDLVLRRRLEHGARKSDVIVEVAFRPGHMKTPPENGRGKIFRARFSIAPGDRQNAKRERFPIVRGEVLVGLQSVFDANDRDAL